MTITAGSVVAFLDLDTSRFSRGLQSAGQQMRSLTDQTIPLGERIQSLGSGITSVGGMLSKGFTLPIMGAGIAIGKTGMEFEAAMSKVKAVSGASAAEMEALTEKAKEMGATTKFSASQSAEALNYMAMA